MTSDHGWVEPVDAGEPAVQHDDLESWLYGIRTDLAGDQPDWLAATSDGAEAPPAAEASPAGGASPADDDSGTGPRSREAQSIGRHRAID
jgi:hypothetical protein